MKFTDYLLIVFLVAIVAGMGYTVLNITYQMGEAAAWELCK